MSNLSEFSIHFEAAIEDLKQKILGTFSNRVSQFGFRSAWEHYEEVIIEVLTEFLTNVPLNISEKNIKKTTSKSVYPDLKIRFNGKDYAIDVKSGEAGRNPWYDIGRLDTYEESHLEKYAGEYCITVKWKNHGDPKVLAIFIEPTYKSVGYRATYNGVLYRPYDGKLRPKSWSEFETNYSYWKDLEHFKIGLKAAKLHRQIRFIYQWYQNMDTVNREQVKKILASVDSDKFSLESANEFLKSLDLITDKEDLEQ